MSLSSHNPWRFPIDGPWNVAVPVTPGTFHSVLPEHEECNVVVEPGAVSRIGALDVDFGADPDAEPLLYSDLQTSLFCHLSGRLGSGRAGAYRGWYLKGIGRTPLAADWHRRDLLHHVGHMTASSAIREWVVSSYLRAVGLEESIVPCVGVLLSPLDPALRDLETLLYANAPPRSLPPVDRHVQAISVKRASFVRPSNLVWLLHHLGPTHAGGGRSSFATFAKWMGTALTPGDETVENLEPADLAHRLEQSLERALDFYRAWFRVGVWWGSFTNNATLDGRFLDLETPSISGGPLFGRLTVDERRGSGTIGFESFYHLAQTRWFCGEICRSLASLPPSFPAIEREFAAELAREIESRLLDESSVLVDRERALDVLRELVLAGREEPLAAASLRQLDRLLQAEHASCFGLPRQRVEAPERRPLPEIPPILSEPGLRWRFHVYELAGGDTIKPSSSQLRRARALAELVEGLDATTDLDRLREKLARVPADVEAIVAATEEREPT